MSIEQTIAPPNEHGVVTMQQIADQCGVGLVTVSRALNSQPGVGKDTAERICRVAIEMGYDPYANQSARRLAKQKYGKKLLHRVIGLLFPDGFMRTPYFLTIYRGILESLAAQGYSLLTMCLNASDPGIVDIPLPQFFSHGDVDGLIVFGDDSALQPMIAQLRQQVGFGERPIVSLKKNIHGCSSVLTDDALGAGLAARHLLDLGHRHIALLRYPLLASPVEPHQEDRARAIRQVMADAGIDASTHLHSIHLPNGWWFDANAMTRLITHAPLTRTEQAHVRPFLEYMTAHPEIAAIIGSNDANAIGACHLMHRFGKPSRDVSVVGFDDTEPLRDDAGTNILTTVTLPLEEMGREAAKLIVQRVHGKCPEETRIVLPATLTVRGSTRPPAG